MNTLEIIRSSNGKVKSLKIDGTKVDADSVVVTDCINNQGVSEVHLVMHAVITGHTE